MTSHRFTAGRAVGYAAWLTLIVVALVSGSPSPLLACAALALLVSILDAAVVWTSLLLRPRMWGAVF